MDLSVSKKDVIWSYLGTAMSLGGNFILLPFLMYYLDSATLGLWYVYLSVGGIVILFDFGFNPTFARNIAYCWNGTSRLTKTEAEFSEKHEPNISLMKIIIRTCESIYLIVSTLALMILLSIGTMYILNISEEINKSITIYSWLIYCAAVFFNLYYGYYATFLRGVGAISQYNKVTIVSRITQIILSIVLLYMGFDLLGVSIGYMVYGLLLRFLSKQTFYKYKNMGILIKEDTTAVTKSDVSSMFKTMWHNAWRDGLVSIANYLANQASIFIASMYFSLTITGIYSVSIQFVTAIATISGSLYNAYQPSLQAAYVKNDVKESKRLMSISMTVYSIMFVSGVILLIFIGIPLITLIKSNMVFDIPLLLAISLYTFLLKNHAFYASFISNTNRVPYTMAFVLSSFLSVVIALLVLNFTTLGIWGLILSQIGVQLFYNNWKWPKVVMIELNTNQREMFEMGWKEVKKVFQIYSKKLKKDKV